MSSDQHIRNFYHDCAKTLILLFNQFPKQQNLWVDDIAGEDQPDAFGLHSERYQAGFSTLLWLAEEGWLRHTGAIEQPQKGLDQAVLTQAAFLCLSSPAQAKPANIAELAQPNHIDTIRQALKEAHTQSIQDAMQHIFQKYLFYK